MSSAITFCSICERLQTKESLKEFLILIDVCDQCEMDLDYYLQGMSSIAQRRLREDIELEISERQTLNKN